jgi:hypothetical protein
MAHGIHQSDDATVIEATIAQRVPRASDEPNVPVVVGSKACQTAPR